MDVASRDVAAQLDLMAALRWRAMAAMTTFHRAFTPVDVPHIADNLCSEPPRRTPDPTTARSLHQPARRVQLTPRDPSRSRRGGESAGVQGVARPREHRRNHERPGLRRQGLRRPVLPKGFAPPRPPENSCLSCQGFWHSTTHCRVPSTPPSPPACRKTVSSQQPWVCQEGSPILPSALQCL